jgi:hypothetical protein
MKPVSVLTVCCLIVLLGLCEVQVGACERMSHVLSVVDVYVSQNGCLGGLEGCLCLRRSVVADLANVEYSHGCTCNIYSYMHKLPGHARA